MIGTNLMISIKLLLDNKLELNIKLPSPIYIIVDLDKFL